MGTRVFLSAVDADKEYASRLKRALRHAGLDAYSDVEVRAGSDWGDHLRSAIDGADAVVVLLSEQSLRSAFVMTEVGAALSARKPIIPVIPPNRRTPHDLPPPFREFNLIRAKHATGDEIAQLVREQVV